MAYKMGILLWKVTTFSTSHQKSWNFPFSISACNAQSRL